MNQEKIGQFIKKIRTDNKLTQREFAKNLGVTYQAVSKWERGQSIPDIAILKDISKKFNIDINDILEGHKNKNKKNNKIILIGIITILLLCIFSLFIINKKNSFTFKTISTTCKEFNITGSAAYNKDKTSIYISNITYCGKEDNIKYKNISCKLYTPENKAINNCTKKHNITLVDYLKDLKINVDNHKTCKSINNNKLYLEISATNENNLITTYKIPLTLNDNCN